MSTPIQVLRGWVSSLLLKTSLEESLVRII